MLIRYPGSKAKLVPAIVRQMPPTLCGPLFSNGVHYVEPFFGAGAVGFDVMRHFASAGVIPSTVHINDIDPGMAALWTSVHDNPSALCDRIHQFRPSVGWFEEFKATDGELGIPPLEAGFRKLALHQMSFSGLGAMAGGPIGGRSQASLYDIGCRWNPEYLQKTVRDLNDTMRAFPCLIVTSSDFEVVLDSVGSEDTLVYLDPPYVEKGPQLYKHSMAEADHHRLARCVQELRCRWVLSYDDHPLVRELYGWADIREAEIVYTGAVAKSARPKNQEVIITP